MTRHAPLSRLSPAASLPGPFSRCCASRRRRPSRRGRCASSCSFGCRAGRPTPWHGAGGARAGAALRPAGGGGELRRRRRQHRRRAGRPQRAPDGTTLLLAGQGILAINQSLYPRLSSAIRSGISPSRHARRHRQCRWAHPQAACAASIVELIAPRRGQRRGRSPYGLSGVGSLSHLSAEVLAAAGWVPFLHVPYPGAALMLTGSAAGRIAFGFVGASGLSAGGTGRHAACAGGDDTTAYRPAARRPDDVGDRLPGSRRAVLVRSVAPSATPVPVLARLRLSR